MNLNLRRGLPTRRDPGQKRIIVMSGLVTAALMVIVCQLWYLQVLEGGRFQEASDKNRIRIRPIAAPRGILFDRNGAPLVDNRPAFTLSLIPREMDRDPLQRDAMLGRLSALIQIPYQELRDAVAKTSPDSFLPVRIRRNLSMEEMQKVEEWKLELPGVIIEAMYVTSPAEAEKLLMDDVRDVIALAYADALTEYLTAQP